MKKRSKSTEGKGLLERKFASAKRRIGIFAELWDFLRVRKKWWLGPPMVILLLLGLLIIFAESSAVAPFIYTLF